MIMVTVLWAIQTQNRVRVYDHLIHHYCQYAIIITGIILWGIFKHRPVMHALSNQHRVRVRIYIIKSFWGLMTPELQVPDNVFEVPYFALVKFAV